MAQQEQRPKQRPTSPTASSRHQPERKAANTKPAKKNKASSFEREDKGSHQTHTSVKKANPTGKPSYKARGDKARGSAEEVRIGDRIVVTIKRIGINGEGVGYYKRKAVFIQGALKDEVVKAKITKVESTYLHAELTEIEKRSPDRAAPPCPIYEACGGCQLQHMTYEAQLRAKEEIVKESFQRYAGIENLPMRHIIGMDDPWHYRNKAQLQAGMEGQKIITGLYAAGSHRLIDISGCTVQDPVVNQVIEQVKQILTELHIPIYDERRREGVVRTIVARIGRASGQVQLTFITATDRIPDVKRLVDRIRMKLPRVSTIAQNIHKEKSSLIFGDKTIILWGEERLEEELGELKFALSPRAFFQLNPEQTVKLYDKVREAASLTGNELVVDAYCGTGTIGLWLAPQAKEVRGIELIKEAVLDARDNARASGVGNARFFEGHAEKLLPEWVKQGLEPDVVVVDPPRTGCERSLLQAIVKARPKRLVYVSCNPSTLAKDCKVLLDQGFTLEWVQPVDMFPQTSHVECCVLLTRK
ncbi:23S rRNA (uracil(1939)-C(5))-methyltransferase RlmD [Paenibacillus sp. 1001270B_150601_E10]|uniref:23S rRNA (uracil(1939)-C(5))-methyltransferase RlmD n=1 Tax=Paenibacillus sp. 1001270B_150601_E10 TaxID=2787079 RepID=UPI00189D6A23|nr:23S rRNA (uracil(1939)-C(5))-methyltransferase RlmD [Paenibacillus sp. 1001270B_150601_E10]